MLQSGLGQLVIDELLYQRGRPPRSRYLFKHALIQDAAYQSLLKRTREASHARPASTSIGVRVPYLTAPERQVSARSRSHRSSQPNLGSWPIGVSAPTSPFPTFRLVYSAATPSGKAQTFAQASINRR